MFEHWEPSLGEVEIRPGDLLVIYTDGITEASNSAGDEFGENRLLLTIRANLARPVPLLVEAILAAALQFSGGQMRDDPTLVVARAR